jgi:hypothetical protein
MAFRVTRDRLAIALLLLAPLLVFTLYGPVFIPSHSCPVFDGRTYIEMIRGVSDHGLPYLANGPAADFPELRARWNSVHDGRLWGMYPPFFAYAAFPFFRIAWLTGSRISMGSCSRSWSSDASRSVGGTRAIRSREPRSLTLPSLRPPHRRSLSISLRTSWRSPFFGGLAGRDPRARVSHTGRAHPRARGGPDGGDLDAHPRFSRTRCVRARRRDRAPHARSVCPPRSPRRAQFATRAPCVAGRRVW